MELLISVWTFFQVNILTQPAFFLGIIVFVGYLLLGRPVYDALAGFIKATVGYLVLNVAAGGLVGNFRPILAGLKERFNLSAVVIDPYFGQTAAQQAIGTSEFDLMISLALVDSRGGRHRAKSAKLEHHDAAIKHNLDLVSGGRRRLRVLRCCCDDGKLERCD